MSYFRESSSIENNQLNYILKKTADECNIYPLLVKLEPYTHTEKNGFIKINLPKDANGNTYIPDDLKKALANWITAVSILVLKITCVSVYRLSLNRFFIGRIKKTVSNTKFLKYMDGYKEKIEKNRPNLHPCSVKEFQEAPYYEKLLSEFREKTAKENAKTLAKIGISRIIDVYDLFKIPELKLLSTALNIIGKNKGLDDKNFVNLTSINNFKGLSILMAIKIILGRYGINFGIVSLYSRLCEYRGQAFMVRLNMTPNGLRFNHLELYYYKTVIEDKKTNKIEKVFLKKRIPDPPEEVYQLSIKDINKEIKKLTSMDQKQMDNYAKGLLKNE